MTTILHSTQTHALLNSVSENIFVINLEYKLVWMNQYARQLMDSLVEELGYSTTDELVGKHINEFHQNPSRQLHILKEGPFPYRTRINVLQYKADIAVTPIKDENGDIHGYMLIWKDVTVRAHEEKELKQLLEDLSAPILPTVIENALLVPLIGQLTIERSELLHQRLLTSCVEKEAEYVIFDFTGLPEIDEVVARELEKLATATGLLGAECIFVGFSPAVASRFQLLKGLDGIKTFHSFRLGILHIMKQQGKQIVDA